MREASSPNDIDFTIDRGNLYREESITDLKVASIRRLIPVKADGTDDPERETVFIGHTQLMSPDGPLPIQAQLEAKTIEQAMDEFPTAMQQALFEVIENIKKMRRQQQVQDRSDQRIIVPGR